MNNKITITGDLGSGKTHISNLLHQELNYARINTGKIQREIAQKLKMTTYELNKYSETHPEIDKQIDTTIKSLENNPKPYIIDSRLAYHFVPSSFKIYLKVEPRVAAQRILKDQERKNETYTSIEEAIQKIQQRKQSENKRYKTLYNLDTTNPKNYDLIVDTTHLTPEQITAQIIQQYKEWQKRQK